MFEVKVTKVDLSDRRKQKMVFKRILEDYELAMDLIDQLEDRYDSSCHSVEFTDLASYGHRREWSI
jgi:hypothetical protein